VEHDEPTDELTDEHDNDHAVEHTGDAVDESAETTALSPSRQVDRLKRTTGGAVMAAGMLGLQQVLDPKVKEDPPIQVDAPGEPPGPPGMDVDFDPDDPAGTTVTFTEE